MAVREREACMARLDELWAAGGRLSARTSRLDFHGCATASQGAYSPGIAGTGSVRQYGGTTHTSSAV